MRSFPWSSSLSFSSFIAEVSVKSENTMLGTKNFKRLFGMIGCLGVCRLRADCSVTNLLEDKPSAGRMVQIGGRLKPLGLESLLFQRREKSKRQPKAPLK